MTSNEVAPSAPVPQEKKPSLWHRFKSRFNAVFLVTVFVPTLVAIVYYGVMASDVYISESRFVVRSPQRGAPTGLSALLASAGVSRSHDDTYTVHGYILSRDALKELEKSVKLREAYSRRDIDLLSRFPGLSWDDSFEAFFRHYTDHIAISYDTASSITTLEVRAFSPELSRTVNELLLQMSERLVNNLNDRSRKDLIVVAKREVEEAEERAKKASLAMSAFRNSNKVFDPAREAGLQLDTTIRLREDLRITEAQIAQLRQVAPSNPQLSTLTAQAARLRQAIDKETGLALGGRDSLSTKAPAYERLALDQEFAAQALATALASLEAARNDAARKQLYLERLVEPNLPDTSLEPRRIRSIFTVFVVGMILWGVISLLIAGVKEHVD